MPAVKSSRTEEHANIEDKKEAPAQGMENKANENKERERLNGNGEGPVGGCHDCGGPHVVRDCPNRKGKG